MIAEHIIHDLMVKAGEDAGQVVQRIAALVDHDRDRLSLALAAAGTTLGQATAYMHALRPEATPEQLADGVLMLLRPMVLAAFADIIGAKNASNDNKGDRR